MKQNHKTKQGVELAVAGFLLSLSLAASAEARSSGQPSSFPVTAYASDQAGEPAATGSVDKGGDDELSCQKARRRLWVEGEGWIVRRVTTCR